MKTNSIIRIFLFCCLAVTAQARDAVVHTYKKGSTVAPFKAADQHGKPYTFKKGTRYLLVSFDMSTGKKANKVLHAKGAAYLSGKKAVFVANIHGMPGIGRHFALPKMRKYAHTIILADAEGLLDPFPSEKGKVTVLKLNGRGVVSAVSFWSPENQNIDDLLR